MLMKEQVLWSVLHKLFDQVSIEEIKYYKSVGSVFT